MFRTENLKWTVPLIAIALVCVAGAVLHLSARGALAQTSPPEMTVDSLINAMQARADTMGDLEGVLGHKMTVPIEGDWQGMPFNFMAPDSFIQFTGRPMSAADASPSSEDNAWRLFRGGEVFSRKAGSTAMLAAGRPHRGRSYGSNHETLIIVNLSPSDWFGPFREDLSMGGIEEVDGQSYYTLLDIDKPVPPGRRLMRYTLEDALKLTWTTRPRRKYYVNAQSFLCERVVLAKPFEFGDEETADPFAEATTDIIAENPQQVGGALLPTRYTKRYYGTSGVYQAREMTLHNLESKGTGAFAAAEFDPRALSPGPNPIVLRPAGRLEDLEKLAERERDDLGLLLTVAEGLAVHGQLDEAKAMLEQADAVAATGAPAEFQAEWDRIWRRLEPKLVIRDAREAPQLQRIYAERAARLRDLGDDKHAVHMDGRAAHYGQVADDAFQRAKELEVDHLIDTNAAGN
ncbi:MAG: hypothetical protein R6V05_10405 [Candidatus Brocadiia bacterium]